MQVTGAGGPRLRSPQSAGRTSRASGFALAGAASAAAAAPAAAPAAISGLLALQDLPEPAVERRRRALGRGRSLLERLDELRLGLLDGSVPLDLLRRLQGELARKLELADEPRLERLIEAIDVRCAVELAKLEAAATEG